MQNELSWSVLEYKEKKHTNDWYWTVGLVTLVVVAACIFFKNYLLGFLILIGISTLTYLTIRKPESVSVTIEEKGIRVREEFFPYRKLKAFWVEEEAQNNGDQHLLVLTDRVYSPLIALPLGDVAPDAVRKLLGTYLKEEEMREDVSHKFIEMLGF